MRKSKNWWSVCVLSALLCACGGEDGVGLSGSNTVNPSVVDNSALSINVNQVFSNYYTQAPTYTLTGDVQGVPQQLTLALSPVRESVFTSGEVSTAVVYAQPYPGDPDVPSETFDTWVFQVSDIGFFRLMGKDYDATGAMRLSWAARNAMPNSAQLGSTGSIGSSQLMYLRALVINGAVSFRDVTYTYSIEPASSAETAWVCENTEERLDTKVVKYAQQFCILSNASSELLEVKLDVQTFDDTGAQTRAVSFR